MDTRVKILSPARAREVVSELITAGEPIAVVRGWFDVLRSTHAELVATAGAEGRCVVALVHGDEESRPTVLDEGSRAQLVAALDGVAYVVICDQAAAQQLTAAWKPAVILDAEEPVTGSVVEDVLQRYRST